MTATMFIKTKKQNKKTKQVASITTKLIILLSIAFMTATAISIYSELDEQQKTTIINNFTNDTTNSTKEATKFLLTYDIITPTYTIEWLPPKNKTTFFWEEIPTIDKNDAPILAIAWLIFFLITKWIIIPRTENKITTISIIILLFVLGTIIVLWGWKAYAYSIFIESAEELGIKESVIAGRANISEEYKNTFWVWVLIGLIGFLILIKAMYAGITGG
jgi:hypothetical protein